MRSVSMPCVKSVKNYTSTHDWVAQKVVWLKDAALLLRRRQTRCLRRWRSHRKTWFFLSCRDPVDYWRRYAVGVGFICCDSRESWALSWLGGE